MTERTERVLDTQTVLNFRFLDAQSIQNVIRDLRLTFTPAALFYCQHYFRTRELRDPSVRELRFFNTVAYHYATSAAGVRISEVQGESEPTRIFRDICRKRLQLFEDTPPTPRDILNTTTQYLQRAGIYATHAHLFVGSSAALATSSLSPTLSLSLSRFCAAVLPHIPPPPTPKAGALLLLPGAESNATQIARLLQEHGEVAPLGIVDKCGLLPHLLNLPGASLHLGVLHENPILAMTAPHADSLLFCAPEQALPQITAQYPGAVVLGTLNTTARLQVHNGMQRLLYAELPFLRSLQKPQQLSLQAPLQTAQADAKIAVSATQNETHLLLGAEVTANAAEAVLQLASEAAARGADMKSAVLAAALELPFPLSREALNNALPLLLGYHRATAELSLSGICHRVCHGLENGACLHVFLYAPRTESKSAERPTTWEQARRVFYGDTHK